MIREEVQQTYPRPSRWRSSLDILQKNNRAVSDERLHNTPGIQLECLTIKRWKFGKLVYSLFRTLTKASSVSVL
ncbi:hypothetical protein T12_14909 [Trichinella patagoniensis]|uniref:Uncharacterized protein n=1 Tax=Trichinella patagoniensis TaxID=990121 RepID=A0A0V1A074_9BILA|nr:hypothetical protein T12_9182 [Trichinella patagoniensis]KRY11077.1 hypothetical protein T12_5424 [Trichinella patagoniensis]KRY17854.1 hypothetical protein T12_10587 [Trichinella patagoniensis]KRY22560.1 hypothetical protein T12_14909 [Trichinella patagoniensis]